MRQDAGLSVSEHWTLRAREQYNTEHDAERQPTRPRVLSMPTCFLPVLRPEHMRQLVVLRLAEITLIEALTSQQVIWKQSATSKPNCPRPCPPFA